VQHGFDSNSVGQKEKIGLADINVRLRIRGVEERDGEKQKKKQHREMFPYSLGAPPPVGVSRSVVFHICSPTEVSVVEIFQSADPFEIVVALNQRKVFLSDKA